MSKSITSQQTGASPLELFHFPSFLAYQTSSHHKSGGFAIADDQYSLTQCPSLVFFSKACDRMPFLDEI